MSNSLSWFRQQFESSAEAVVWAVTQIDTDLLFTLPPEPRYLGTWPPARHIWHLAEYEQCFAFPSMQQWLGGAKPASFPEEEKMWHTASMQSIDALIKSFQVTRQAQINLLARLTDSQLHETKDTLWGGRPLKMVVTKTFQHTLEHCDTLLRMGIWWRAFVERDAAQKRAVGE